MSLPLSQTTIPYWVRQLNVMIGLLDKAEAFCATKKVDPSVLLSARLAPDMRPVTSQVQMASDMVKFGAARLSGDANAPSFPDTETTFEELRARLRKTIDYLQSVDAAALDAGETRTIEIKLPNGALSFGAVDYAFGWVYANLHFHAATLYDILRHNGVELGKRDYLGGV